MLNQSLIDNDVVSFQANTIYCGDCKDVLRHFPENSVDLIYLDPPFFSNRHYEVIWGDGYEIRAFEDRWLGGVHNYIAWMDERVRECHRVLKETGSLYLHCDTHASHHLRVMLDNIFLDNNFVSEIYWYYYNKMHDYRKKVWPKATDTILMYAKERKSDYTFNQQEEDREKPVKQLARKKVKGKMVNVKDESGHVVYRVRDKRTVDNVWRISTIQPADRTQRYDFPTQKPEALLDRIIKASSNPKDIVLDPFCGCGTAIAVAERLGRRWIGVDVSPSACKLMKRRMNDNKVYHFGMIGLPRTAKHLKEIPPYEFQNWVMDKLYARVSPRKVGDMGIDGYSLDGTPIQVKQSDDIGRNVIDNFETAIQRHGKKKGVIVAFSFGRGAYEEVARVKQDQGIEIILRTTQDLIDQS
jgi:DNA modification methylase